MFDFQVADTDTAKYEQFLKINQYCSGNYDKAGDFSRLNKLIEEHGSCNRLFYLALPPSVYESVTLNIKATCMAKVYVYKVFYFLVLCKPIEPWHEISNNVAF